MKIQRRGFLGSLLAFATLPGVAKGKILLWPNRELRIPLQLKPGGQFSESDIIAMELERVSEIIPQLWERDDHFFAAIENVGTRERQGTRRRKGRGRSQRGRRG